jgi:hypothetical protein
MRCPRQNGHRRVFFEWQRSMSVLISASMSENFSNRDDSLVDFPGGSHQNLFFFPPNE